MFLPAVKEKAFRHSDENVDLGEYRGHGERILAVEDAEGVGQFLRTALTGYGYFVFTASNTR